MKKVILLLIIAGFGSRLRAQQMQTPAATNIFKPDTSRLFKNFNNNFYKTPGINMQPLAQLRPVTGGVKLYSHMPVVTTYPTQSVMPVYIPGKRGEKYPMLIKRIDVINPDTLNKVKILP